LVIPLCFSLSHFPIATPLLQLQPSPRTISPEGYVCNELCCTSKCPFKTKPGLIRHGEVNDLQNRLDCPIQDAKAFPIEESRARTTLVPMCGIRFGFGYPTNHAKSTLYREYHDISHILDPVHPSSLNLVGFAMARMAFSWWLDRSFHGSICSTFDFFCPWLLPHQIPSSPFSLLGFP